MLKYEDKLKLRKSCFNFKVYFEQIKNFSISHAKHHQIKVSKVIVGGQRVSEDNLESPEVDRHRRESSSYNWSIHTSNAPSMLYLKNSSDHLERGS